jgi:phosphoglycerate dehydrogenase-like enzyme
MTRVVIPDDYPEVLGKSPSLDRLRERFEVAYYNSLPGSEATLVERLQDADAAINIRSSTKITASVFARLPRLKMLSIWGTGTDNVDLAAARERGIRVTNTPAVAAASIAEHTLALLLAAARRIPAIDAEVRAGKWPRGQMLQLSGKTLGVIGLGAIGRRFAKLGEGIGMKVLTWTMNPKPELGFAHVELDRLLAESDAVSLHLRLSDQTRNFLNASRLAQMKPGAILVNTARGPIVDEAALIAALESGRLRAAGLDVFDQEPLPPDHPITKLPNVVLSPHNAGVTAEALEAGLALAVDNVFAFHEGRVQHAVA